MLRLIAAGLAKGLSKLFGVATHTFFGRAPSQDDDRAGLVGLLSVAWVAVLVGLAWPAAATAAIPALPDDDALVRAGAAGLALAGGPVVGLLIGRAANRRERGGRLAVTAVAGYGYAAVIGGLAVALAVTVPAVKGSHLLRRLEMQHMTVMITPEAFDGVERRIRQALAEHGVEVDAESENRLMAAIFRGLVWAEERIFWRDMARGVRLLRGELAHGPLVVELHPTDLAVRARRPDATYAFAVLADTLDHRDVYFSWDADAQAFEDRLREARRAAADGDPPGDERLAALAEELRGLGLGPDEWSALRRQLHRLEAEALRARLGRAGAAAAAPADQPA